MIRAMILTFASILSLALCMYYAFIALITGHDVLALCLMLLAMASAWVLGGLAERAFGCI